MSAPSPQAFIGKYFKDVIYQKYYYVHGENWEVTKTGNPLMNNKESKIIYFKECDIFLNPTKGKDNALTMQYFLSGLSVGIYKFLNITTL